MIHDSVSLQYLYQQVTIVMLRIVMITLLLLVYQLIITVMVGMIAVHGSHVSSFNDYYIILYYIIHRLP